jgi:DNA repair photolyase
LRRKTVGSFTAFAPDDFFCDTSEQPDLVEHTTSWLAINPVIGCSLDCCYCFRLKWRAPNQPVQVVDLALAIQKLVDSPLFVPHHTPLTVNISSTDAMLPSVKSITFECIRRIEEAGYKNIFGITTKVGFDRRDIEFLTSVRNLRLVILITYSEMPIAVEPYPAEPRIASLRLLQEVGIPAILYYRPIVPGWNDNDERIKKVLTIGQKYSKAIAMAGLRLSPEIRDEIKRKGLSVPFGQGSFHPKLFPRELEERILRIYESLRLSVPLYKHTSCAVSYIFNICNYNGLFRNPGKNCLSTCPHSQRATCGISF